MSIMPEEEVTGMPGSLARQGVRPATVDAILMDCQKPVMDGFEAVQQIRISQNGGPRTPVIALTANVLPGERTRCLEADMDDFLPKPIKLHSLQAVLEKWTAASSAEMSAVGAESLN